MAEKRIIEIELRGNRAEANAKRLDKSVKGIGESADRAESSLGKLSRVASAVATALVTAKIAQYADTWTQVSNRINAATNSITEFKNAQDGIFNIAQRASTDLLSVADTYSRISQTTKNLGLTQGEVLDVTNRLTLALKANGATAQETGATLRQIAQGLASGVLQGDELRAVMESSVPLVLALAKEFNVTVGEVKKLGSEGKITSDRVISAIQNMDEQALTFQKTIGDGFQNLFNSLTRLTGEIDTATGVSGALSDGLIGLANSVDFLSDAVASGAAGEIADLFAGQLDLIAGDVDATVQFISQAWNSLGINLTSQTQGTTLDIGDAFLNIIPNIRSLIQIMTVEFASGIDRLKAFKEAVVELANPFDGFQTISEVADKYNAKIEQIDQTRQDSINTILDENEQEKTRTRVAVAEANTRIEAYRAERDARRQALADEPSGAGGTRPNGTSSEQPTDDAAARTQARLALETEFIRQELALREQLRLEDATKQEAEYQLDLLRISQQYQLRAQKILEMEFENESQRQALLQELFEQEAAAQQLKEEQLTDIAKEGAEDRKALLQGQISDFQNYASTALTLAQAFGSKNEKRQKKLQKAQVVINTAAGIARAFAENDFYSALGISAMIAANGAAQIATINSAGGGGSAPQSPSRAAPTPASPAPTPAPTQSQRRIIDLRGFPEGGVTLNKEQLVNLLESDEDVIVAASSGQANGNRIGLLNG